MLSIITFTILGTIFIASAIFSGLAYRKQQALSFRKSQIRQIKSRIDSLKDNLSMLLRVDKEYQLIQLIQEQIILFSKKLTDLAPEDEALLRQLDEELKLADLFENKNRPNDIRQAMDNDQELSIANFQLVQAAKFLNKHKKQGRIPQGKYSELILHLQRLTLDVDVASHIAQADRYIAANDRIIAQSHLKQAKETLRTNPIDYPEKAELMKDLGDRIKSLQRNISIVQETSDTKRTTNHAVIDKNNVKKKQF
ncbi:MAG: hypothetical protein H7A00_08820 [Hahellaceae bacterium]|nr:hypothetical protein [Hahellaceae bacterium]